MQLRTVALVALLSCAAVLVALRHREPDRAVMRPWRELVLQPVTVTGATAENIWRLLEAQPGFAEGMERGRADFEAGRFTRFEHRERRSSDLDFTDTDLQPSDPYPASFLP